MQKNLARLDWIDALLFAVGFTLVVGLATAVSSALQVDAGRGAIRVGIFALGFGPIVLRRVLFGPPDLPEPRRGALWSLVSMLGLLAILFGVPLLGLGGLALASAAAPAPDFDAEARETAAEVRLPSFSISVSDPGETPEQRAAREAAEAAREAAQQEQRIHDLASDLQRDWDQRQRSGLRTGATAGGIGLVLLLAGAGLTRLRYATPRR